MSFVINDAIDGVVMKYDPAHYKKTSKLAIFNDVLFANWFLCELFEQKVVPKDDRFLMYKIFDQADWDFIRSKLETQGINSALLNPCIAKDHKCPFYKFSLEEERDFNNLLLWFSKAPNYHYTIKGKGETWTTFFKKPTMDNGLRQG